MTDSPSSPKSPKSALDSIPHPPAAQMAAPPMTFIQLAVLLGVAGTLLLLLCFEFYQTAFYLNSAIIFAYLFVSVYKLVIIVASLKSQRVAPEPLDLTQLDERELPMYTVLVPLFKEEEQIPVLIDTMSNLDYPKDRLEVLFLLEESDRRSVELCKHLEMPSFIRTIIVPPSHPQTKPKACNYGLREAHGDYLVIFDAEDRPEPDQLKKALATFKKHGDEVVCVQARLNFFNSRYSLLTRWFTAEYSTWFDLYLPGLNHFDAPIPLGGTSNHFRMSVLRELAGWDPYNVAEDCDLGMRLYRRGFRTRMLNSTTWEEACAHLGYWTRQRSRWVKGYMQTWLVHNRSPLRTLREMGLKRFFHFQLLTGGMTLLYLLNPFYWVMALLWFIFRWDMGAFFPPSVFMMGFLCLFIGNFLFVYTTALGCLGRRRYDLVKWVMLIPPYWILMSVAAWRGLIQLIVKPYYWDKTKHGMTGN